MQGTVGLVVTKVASNSPAYTAGLEVDDVIIKVSLLSLFRFWPKALRISSVVAWLTKINNTPTPTPASFPAVERDLLPGDNVSFQVSCVPPQVVKAA